MTLVYEGKKYIFHEKWLSENSEEISDIFSNFLCEKAIQDGADPELFSHIVTPVKTRITKIIKKEKKVEPYKSKRLKNFRPL